MRQGDPATANTALDSAPDQSPGLLGIWDLEKAPIKLGDMILFVADLHAQALLSTAGISGICFVGDLPPQLTSGDMPLKGQTLLKLEEPDCSRSVLLSTLLSINGVDTCYWAPSLNAVENFMAGQPGSFAAWPPIDGRDKDGNVDYDYGTTMFLQRIYRENGTVPLLTMKPTLVKWARNFIATTITPSLPVVVHLKNNKAERGCSNANLDAWHTFFESCLDRYDVKFILIGNEEANERIYELPNVLATKPLDCTLAQELALIQASRAFMGMSSGPANMAICSDRPYVIYKNPDHHVAEMEIEMGRSDRFPFATDMQRFLRKYETAENLESEFLRIHSAINYNDSK